MGAVLLLLGLLGVPVCIVIIIVFAVRKKPIKNPALALLASAIIFFVGVALIPASGDSTRETESPANAEMPIADNTADYMATPESMTALLEQTSRSDPTNITIDIYPETGECRVVFTRTRSVWDETDLVRKELTGYVDFCRDAFSVDGITKVSFYVRGKMTDTHGNEEEIFIVKIAMEKDKFLSYNWDNMEYKTDSFRQIKEDCELFDVHAGIMSRADESKIYYAP